MDPQVVDRRKRPPESGIEGLTKRAKSANDQRTAFIRHQGAKFGAHCDGAREKKEPRRLLYPKLGTARSQTLTCSNLALEHFNKSRGHYYCLDMGQPMDSTVFEHTHSRINPGQAMCYFHVNFWARGSRGASEMFFAELRGLDEPNETTTVTTIGNDEDTLKAKSREHICMFCTGILHPRRGSFLGRLEPGPP